MIVTIQIKQTPEASIGKNKGTFYGALNRHRLLCPWILFRTPELLKSSLL